MDTASPLPVPGPHPHGRRWSFWVGATVVLATFGEFAVVIAGVRDAAPLTTLIAAHLAIGSSLVLICVPRSSPGRINPEFLLFLICILAMGPLGPLGTGVTTVLRRWFARRATPFDAWYDALFPEIVVTRTQALYRQIILRGAGPASRSTVAPFLDILAVGTVEQKRAVIAMIAAEFRPAFAPALQGALNDVEPAIRVQAASAVAHIEGRFLNRAMMLQARCTARPDDSEAVLVLARHLEAYAESGLLDESRAHAELAAALACYQRLGEMRPDDTTVIEAVARLLLRLGRYEEAMRRLGPLIARSNPSTEAVAEYLACLFRRGQFAGVRKAARLFSARFDLADLPHDLGEALRLWSGNASNELAAHAGAGGAPA